MYLSKHIIFMVREKFLRQLLEKHVFPFGKELEGSWEKCVLETIIDQNYSQVRFDFEDFELHASKAGSCDVDTMTLINSPDGTGGTFCGFKGRRSDDNAVCRVHKTRNSIMNNYEKC